MRFGTRVQRQTRRALRLQHRLILREDGVLKSLQRCIGGIKVGHGQAEPDPAGLRRQRADKERDRFTPSSRGCGVRLRYFGQHGCIGRGHFVTVFHHRALRRMHMGLRLPGPAVGGQQTGGSGFYRVIGNRAAATFAQPARVHKTEVRHVQKILHNARCAGRHVIRAAVDFAQTGIALGGKQRHTLRPLHQTNPDQAVSLVRRKNLRTVPGRRHKFRQGWHMHTAPRFRKAPAVVRALELPIADPPQREARPPVRAAIGPGMGLALRVAPQHHGVVHQLDWLRFVAQCRTVYDGMPIRRSSARRVQTGGDTAQRFR